MPRCALLILALGCLVAFTAAEDAEVATFGKTWYKSIPEALRAASAPGSDLSTFAAAVNASGMASAVTRDTKWTILAPTNTAFAATLTRLNLTAAAVLSNQQILTTVLSYHIIPEGAIISKRFFNNRQYATLVQNRTATPEDLLTARVTGRLARRSVTFVSAVPLNNATVVEADIKAGKSIIHKINNVLLPAAIVRAIGK